MCILSILRYCYYILITVIPCVARTFGEERGEREAARFLFPCEEKQKGALVGSLRFRVRPLYSKPKKPRSGGGEEEDGEREPETRRSGQT